MKRIIASVVLAATCTQVSADISESDLADLKGYAVLGVWTLKGWQDPGKGGKKGDSFEGCEHDRILIFEGDVAVQCDEYKYAYAYRPKAVIFGDGRSLRMVLGGRIYRVKSL